MPVTIENIAVDAADAGRLAAFWSAVLERPVDEDANQYFASIGRGASTMHPTMMFLQVPEERAGKNRIHLDLVAEDHQFELSRLERIGAKRLGDFAEYGITWTTFADPEGNVFDVAAGH